MIKATKKELERALELASRYRWAEDVPNSNKCQNCLTLSIDNCMQCWKDYYINLAKEEGTK